MNPTQESRLQLLIRLVRGSKRFFICSILCTALMSLVEMIVPQVISMTVDSVIGDKPLALQFYLRIPLEALGVDIASLPGYFSSRLWLLAIIVAGLALLAGLFRYTATLMTTRGSETLVKGMRDKLFRQLQQLPFHWHNQNQTGDLIQRCTNDVDMIRNFVSMQLISVFRIVIMMILSLTFMFSLEPKLAVVSLCTIPIIMAYSAIFGGKIGDFRGFYKAHVAGKFEKPEFGSQSADGSALGCSGSSVPHAVSPHSNTIATKTGSILFIISSFHDYRSYSFIIT